MALQGSLKELPLPDIIQLLAVSRKSGTFSIEDGERTGRIFLRDGQIVHAEVGGIRGEEAIYELSVWIAGDFHFHQGEIAGPEETTIQKPNARLLMEAARRIDEWRVLSKKIPSTRMVPVLTATDSSRGVSLNARERSVVEHIDDRSTLEEIALTLDESPFEIAKVAFGLVTAHVMELRESPRFMAPERLLQLSPEALTTLTTRAYEEAFDLLTSNDSLGRLESLHDRTLKATDTEAVVTALVEQVRGSQQLMSADLGTRRAGDFYRRVEELIGEL